MVVHEQRTAVAVVCGRPAGVAHGCVSAGSGIIPSVGFHQFFVGDGTLV